MVFSPATVLSAGNGENLDSTILLSGKVPSSIKPAFAVTNYKRVWRVLAPDRPIDPARITILFYTGSEHAGPSVRLPEWSGGGAAGPDLIVIPVDRPPLPEMDFGRIVVHELTHIALERAYGRIRIPRWFHEGMAMTLCGELAFEEQVSLSRAVVLHRLLPLDTIEFVNRFDQPKASLAYSECHFAAAYMIDKYGIDGVPELLKAVRQTGRFDSAFVQVFGFSDAEFDRMVRTALADRYRFMLFFSDSYLFWILLAILVIVAFIVIRRRIARRERAMEEEERNEDRGKRREEGKEEKDSDRESENEKKDSGFKAGNGETGTREQGEKKKGHNREPEAEDP